MLSTASKTEKEVLAESHCDMNVQLRKCTFSWTINQYSVLCKNGKLKSSEFSAMGDDFKWYLAHEFHLDRDDSSSDDSSSDDSYSDFLSSVKIMLCADPVDLAAHGPVHGDVAISVLKADNSKVGTKNSSFKLCIDHDDSDSPSQTAYNVSTLQEMEEYTFQDKLTIFCELSYSKNTDISTSSTLMGDRFFHAELSRDLQAILKDEKFSDVTISVRGKNYPVHKAILAARSSVFNAMFRNYMLESKKNHIVINDMSRKTFQEMLRYIYTGEAKNLNESAADLLQVADKYDLKELKTACEEVLFQKLSTDNVSKVLILADMHHCGELKAQTLRFIKLNCINFGDFKNTELWNVLNTTHPYLMKDVLNVFFEK